MYASSEFCLSSSSLLLFGWQSLENLEHVPAPSLVRNYRKIVTLEIDCYLKLLALSLLFELHMYSKYL